METTAAAMERDCSAIGSLFSLVISEMKSGSSNWEDLVIKATKFHAQLKATIVASTAFLDSFQKIADMATSTRGKCTVCGVRSEEAVEKPFASSFPTASSSLIPCCL